MRRVPSKSLATSFILPRNLSGVGVELRAKWVVRESTQTGVVRLTKAGADSAVSTLALVLLPVVLTLLVLLPALPLPAYLL